MATDLNQALANTIPYKGKDAFTLDLLRVALLRELLLQISPNAVTNPNALLADMACYKCLSPFQLKLIEISLLQSVIDAGAVTMNQAVFSETTGLVVNGVPTVVPEGETAICILNDGTMFTYYGGAWH